MRTNLRRPLVSLAAWLVGAGVALTVGLFSLSLVRNDFAAQTVQTFVPDSVAGPASPEPPQPKASDPGSPPPSARPTVSGTQRLLTSAGGSVLARCGSEGAFLVSWSPAQGYRADDVRRGPAAVAAVSFVAVRQQVTMRVYCAAGVPQATIDHDDDEYGH